MEQYSKMIKVLFKKAPLNIILALNNTANSIKMPDLYRKTQLGYSGFFNLIKYFKTEELINFERIYPGNKKYWFLTNKGRKIAQNLAYMENDLR